MYGMIEIDGVKYIERVNDFTRIITVTGTTPITSERVNLRGVGHFLLKGIGRETIASGVIAARRFLFKLGNSDGMTFYSTAGVQTDNDRVIDTLYFGNAQFPRLFTPPIFFTQNGSMILEIESIATAHPYDLYLAFYGSYLIPV